MDRELVFAVLIAALCGAAISAAGWWSFKPAPASGSQEFERQMWRRIWLPFAPALILFAVLCGWAWMEPADAEPAPKALILWALPFAIVFGRAVWHATRSLNITKARYTIATVGLFRPKIIVAQSFADALDHHAMAAAMEHERAHARHLDPLRLWLAQLGTELQWPAPAAMQRLQTWKRALEVARDDEARAHGAVGPDLAAAILLSLRMSNGILMQTAARLTDETFVRERVTRLLQPPQPEAPSPRRFPSMLFILSLAIPLAMLFGIKFGERLIGALLLDA